MLQKKANSNQRTQATYTIPVVVHIIHNGQPLGTGSHITDAQVLSQIKVLNNDFQRLNSDASQTPSTFQSVAGSMSIEFVLAKQNPLGEPTSGIVRVNGGKSSWNLYEDYEIKSKSYWPAEQYLNIWVTNFPAYLGYAQFPVSNLSGITDSPNDRLTDGVIVHYRAFGSIDDGAFDLESRYNKGRTLTHEMGHYFGLRHIWGDGASCGATDYVSDTPSQIGSTSGCPTHPAVECSSQPKMFQNYLDYSNDQCMNIFTVGQISRMDIVLNNSIRRASLLTSPGALPPGNFVLDLGIIAINTPTTLECSGLHTPTITIRNFGTTVITQANIEFSINGVVQETKLFALNLSTLTQTQVSFNVYTSNPLDSKNYQFKILTANGATDENSSNNISSLSVKTAQQATTPYVETFELSLANWNVVNPDGLTGWTLTTLPNGAGKAVSMNNYSYENEGAIDKLVSPAFDVSSAGGLLLKFKHAHSQYPGVVGDALSVYALTGCTDDLSTATRVFFKEGASLATTTSKESDFIPDPGDWITNYIPLSAFVGSTNLRIAFVSRNGYGNNIYVDNVELLTASIMNLSLQELVEPSVAVCESTVQPKIKVANLGTEIIDGLVVLLTKNGVTQPSQSFTDIISPGETAVLTLNDASLSDGLNSFSITATPNGNADSDQTDNSLSSSITLINNSSRIPARETFDGEFLSWSTINSPTIGWEFKATDHSDFELSAIFEAFDNTNVGQESWLVSPKLDFSKAIEASMFVDFSYGSNSSTEETVIVSASNDCGNTFSKVLFSGSAADLSDNSSSSYWEPSSDEDWTRKYFNLNELVGEQNVLVAIKATSSNGNNLYVDNIEFFENDDPTPPVITKPFQVYTINGQTYLTFNLEQSETVQVQVANIMGSLVADVTQENTLNQTLTFQLGVNPAIYIFKIRIGTELYAVRQYMGN